MRFRDGGGSGGSGAGRRRVGRRPQLRQRQCRIRIAGGARVETHRPKPSGAARGSRDDEFRARRTGHDDVGNGLRRSGAGIGVERETIDGQDLQLAAAVDGLSVLCPVALTTRKNCCSPGAISIVGWTAPLTDTVNPGSGPHAPSLRSGTGRACESRRSPVARTIMTCSVMAPPQPASKTQQAANEKKRRMKTSYGASGPRPPYAVPADATAAMAALLIPPARALAEGRRRRSRHATSPSEAACCQTLP